MVGMDAGLAPGPIALEGVLVPKLRDEYGRCLVPDAQLSLERGDTRF